MRRTACAWAVAAALTTSSARAEPLRVLVAAGQTQGLAGQPTLRHADADASRFRDVMVSLGGVKADQAILVTGATRARLMAAIEQAKKAAAAAEGAAEIFVYISGHGDQTHLDMAGEAVPLGDIEAALRAVPASLRVLVTDACRTVEPTRTKGISDADPFALRLDAPAARGFVWMQAASDGQVAQESDALGGSLFTSFLVSGLRGAADANGDARVTLDEAYSYAYSQTLFRSARVSGTMQRPSVRQSLDETGPVVVTRTSRASARLTLPAGADAQYLLYAAGTRGVLAEVWGRPDAGLELAVPPGVYVLYRRLRGTSAATDIVLAKGEQRTIGASDFRAVAAEVLAAKGGALELRRSRLGVASGAGWTQDGGVGPTLTLLADRWGDDLGVGARLAATVGGSTHGRNDVQVQVAQLDAVVQGRLVTGPFELSVGAGPSLMMIAEQLRRTDAAKLEGTGYPTRSSYVGLGGGLVVEGLARWAVPDSRWQVMLGARGGAVRAPTDPAGGRTYGWAGLVLGASWRL